MNRHIVIDTEGTGLFRYRDEAGNSVPADAPGQPRLASLAMLWVDEDGSIEKEESFYVKPDGWAMTAEAGDINGLTDEFLAANGVPITEVLAAFKNGVMSGRVIAAYNVSHDLKHMRGELRRAGLPDLFESTPNICLMRACTDVCRVPKKNGKGFKFPKLAEACAHFKIAQPAAHSAIGDARSAAAILLALQALGVLPKPEVHYAKTAPTT